jgi:hypothetical protein
MPLEICAASLTGASRATSKARPALGSNLPQIMFRANVSSPMMNYEKFGDRYWYHRLLVGSVNHAIAIEKKYKDDMPELSLSDAIGAISPYKPGYMVNTLARVLVCHDKYRKTGQLHSEGKIELFYKSVMLALILTMIVLAFAGGVTFNKATPPARADSATSTVAAAPNPNPPAVPPKAPF